MSIVKRNIRITAVSPGPKGLRNGSHLVCCRCNASFKPSLDLGTYVIALSQEFLPLCTACGEQLPEADVRLLVAADVGNDTRALKERLQQAVTLRQGRITSSFE